MNKIIKIFTDTIKQLVTSREFFVRFVTGVVGFFGLVILYFFCPPVCMTLFTVCCMFAAGIEFGTFFFPGPWKKENYSAKIKFTICHLVACLFVPLFLMSDDVTMRVLLPLLFIMVVGNDTGAYITGKLFGKHKLAPAISPNKTVEGLVGGCLSTLLVTILYVGKFTVSLIPLCLIVSVLATLGDLAESYLKRRAGVKDSGSILPGHGGLLDRFDSILPVSWFFLVYAPYILELL